MPLDSTLKTKLEEVVCLVWLLGARVVTLAHVQYVRKA
jgi:hypothetical protein